MHCIVMDEWFYFFLQHSTESFSRNTALDDVSWGGVISPCCGVSLSFCEAWCISRCLRINWLKRLKRLQVRLRCFALHKSWLGLFWLRKSRLWLGFFFLFERTSCVCVIVNWSVGKNPYRCLVWQLASNRVTVPLFKRSMGLLHIMRPIHALFNSVIKVKNNSIITQNRRQLVKYSIPAVLIANCGMILWTNKSTYNCVSYQYMCWCLSLPVDLM